MNVRPSILCPVDFSQASAGALHYAAAVASRFGTRLIALTVEEPLLTEALDLGTGVLWSPDACRHEMERFAAHTFGDDADALATVEYEVAVGKPAAEILRVARERSCDLIVMSTHGATGIRRLFFGSTTERVLRETVRPVLITPPIDPGPLSIEDAGRLVRRIVVPVDLSSSSGPQAQAGAALAKALGLPLLLVHVLEPLRGRFAAHLPLVTVDANRRALADDALAALTATIPSDVRSEALVAYGDPAEEIAKVAHDRAAGLIVMGLHGSPLLGPRMGSVTYRLLCVSRGLVLAIPPAKPGAVALPLSSPTTAAVSTVAMLS